MSDAGLDILHHDESVVVLVKPAGLLSIPGRGPDKQDCVSSRLRALFPACIEQPSVHRLDMATSGVMVYALTTEAHRNLSIQFQNRKVTKKYTAVLEGVPEGMMPGQSGQLELPFRLDPDDRPRQVFDPERGKVGVTRWQCLGVERGRARMRFVPLTGRTHQLRVHSAHERGLGCPIAGDGLYGNPHSAGRLLLHADFLEFAHPRAGKTVRFAAPVPF
jgi:tRNA pseudouridine32 synthase/23S rRNA pseudouridine746 synthase